MRSSASSSPTARRRHGPPADHVVTLRVRSGYVGMTRLSKPPQLHPIEKSSMPFSMASTRSSATGCRITPNSDVAPRKSRFQSSWPRAPGQRRIQHFLDLRLRAQPLRDAHRARLLAIQARRERAQPAQPEEAIVAGRGDAHVGPQAEQRRVRGFVGDDRAEQHVRMAADVLGRRMHGHVHAVVERAKIERRRPRVVEHRPRAARTRRVADRAHVLHLERERPRRLQEHEPRVGLHPVGDAGADQRIVVLDVDAETP